MSRSISVRFATALCCLALSACDSGPSKEDLQARVEELEGQVSELQTSLESAQGQLASVRDEVDNVGTAASQLEAEVGRFDGEDWADVVPAVKSAQEEISRTHSDLEDAAAEQ